MVKKYKSQRFYETGSMDLSPEARKKLEEPFLALATDLRIAAEKRQIVFMQNDGNYGDALIRYGTLRFLEDQGLEFTEFDMGRKRDKLACMATGLWDRLQDKYLFVYSCSGAWSTATDLGYRNIRNQRYMTKNLFVLPTTFQEHRMKLDFPVYARDRFQSKDFIRDKPFCHDMAFYLALISPERFLPNRQPPIKKVGMMLRTDNESANLRMKNWPQNFDASAAGGHRDNPQNFLRYIDQFEHVVTDRLHIAIGGALLGKHVTLLNGSYFKIKALYESSIVGIFDNVEFIENPSENLSRELALLSLQKDNEDYLENRNESSSLSLKHKRN